MQELSPKKLETSLKENVAKHAILRIVFLVAALLIILYRASYSENGWWVLMGLVLGFGLAIIWFFFILVETFILYSKKKNKLAKMNLAMLGIFVFFGLLIYYYLN